MPVEELGAHTAGLNKEENLYVYCLSGGRSQIGVAQLDAAGFANVFNVTSGLLAWRAANLPLVNS
jgi:rhodanese-related sulfurtransferase